MFADRGFLEINGVFITHLTTATVSVNQNLSRVSTMTRNRRDAGYAKGNLGVQLSLELAIERLRPQIDLALADDDAELTAVFEVGGERYTVLGLAVSDTSVTASVGSTSKSMNLEGLDVVNENGNSVNAGITLG